MLSGIVRSPGRFLFSRYFQVGLWHVWVIDVVVPTSAGGQPGPHAIADREALTAVMSSCQRILTIGLLISIGLYRIYIGSMMIYAFRKQPDIVKGP